MMHGNSNIKFMFTACLAVLSTAHSLDHFHCNLSLDVCDKLRHLEWSRRSEYFSIKNTFLFQELWNRTIQIYSNLKCIISLKMRF